VGAGGFRVVWRQERRVAVGVREVHSVVLEAATELGLPGLLFLGLIVVSVAAAGRRALRERAPIAAGACAACSVWLMHAAIDWDLQLPAVTLPVVVLAGALLAASEVAPSLPAECRQPADLEVSGPRAPG
jgi:O-antigen ligase